MTVAHRSHYHVGENSLASQVTLTMSGNRRYRGFVVLLCALGSGATAVEAGTPVELRLDIAAADPQGLPDTLFGIAWNWLNGGGGTIEYGELIRDRSFRGQQNPMNRVWIEAPNSAIQGTVEHQTAGGDMQPLAGVGYPGYFRLRQQATGYTCISQEIREGVSAGARYELHVSGIAEQGRPALSVFLSDLSYNPIEELDNLSWIDGEGWRDYAFTLEPQRDMPSVYLRICLVAPGVAGVDEIRLRQHGAEPRVKAAADSAIQALGVRSLRWPTGSDADYFDWQASVGPLQQRGESPSAFGDYQTASLGLHEFLDYCEQRAIVPLITVNVREAPDKAADLVEYVLGAPDTPQGRLRAQNGRTAPWSVRHFELGNEPVDAYRGRYPPEDAALGYAEAASAIAQAMRARAAAVGKDIALQGVVDATFAIADWIAAVPMLARWNSAVLGRDSPLREHLDYIKGNFYSGFNYRRSAAELFREIMAGGATIVALVAALEREYGALPPFWLTEYSVMVQKSKLLGGAEIQLDRTNDLQAGLAAADILMNAIDAGFGGAYLFNLAARGTWGVLEIRLDDHARFDTGPAGLAFSLLAPMAGKQQVPVSISGARTVTLSKGDGASPAKTTYATVGAVAASGGGVIELVLLNRSYDETYDLTVAIPGAGPRAVTVHRLQGADLEAKNIDGAGQVSIVQSTAPPAAPQRIELPPRALFRVTFALQ